ncbi:MAG: DUF3987 domain-containing protein [Candidatus Accumulibacter sp.]|nr:DUF3987 domain-containing protein [Candidatus Accumulibacter propinquus]
MTNPIEQFREAIHASGLTPPEVIEADGKLRRFASNGRRNDDAGWYLIHDDGIPAGSFGDWRTGLAQSWRADVGRALTLAEEAEHRAKVEAMRREREADETRRRAEAAATAAAIVTAETPATDNHAYLVRKGIKANGALLHQGKLVIPMRADGRVHSLQFIGADGEKRFLTGGRVAGCYFSIGNVKGAAVLCVAEGFATGASIHEATGYPVAVAFNAGNLLATAQAMRAKFPDLPLILCADDDYRTEGNPGMTKAAEAARAVGGLVAVPGFGADRPEGATDFNDLAQRCGAESVQQAIAGAVARARADCHQVDESSAAGDTASPAWPEPQPLSAKIEPEPYPIDALPETIRAAVEEVAGFVKAPLAMVASSALGVLSLACQAHVDVKRAEKLTGPASLFLLTIGDSGERKSTCDGFFVGAVKDYQAQQAALWKPEVERYEAELDSWSAERNGILEAIKAAGKSGKSTDDLRASLAQLQHNKPEAPRVPRLLLGDETPENLAWRLAREWPSAGVVSSEAGLILGAHGMKKDSVMRNLGLLNLLWDGGELSIGRRTSESFTVKGARLTVALQIQEVTLRSFFDKAGALARGSGFLARFLVAWPESTQGCRPFTESPDNWPHLAAFHRRIDSILNLPAPIGEDGALTPQMLAMTPAAKSAWVEYHDAIEKELRSGGELYDVRDVASKSADNAVRLAALFHVFEHGAGAVGLEAFEGASRIAAWHLSESRRFFGELALPAELADAARLDTWVVDYCRREHTHLAGKNHVRQHGPLRDGGRLDAAIKELVDLDRLQIRKDGKRVVLHVNPALIGISS